MTFRKPYKVLREAAGAYVAGVWVPGARSVLNTSASVQPVVSGQDLQAVPENRRLSDAVKVYTSDNLKVTREGESEQPDIVVFDGYGFELVSRYANQSGVINHYKFMGSKVFKFTTDADWVNGVLKR